MEIKGKEEELAREEKEGDVLGGLRTKNGAKIGTGCVQNPGQKRNA